MRTTDQQLLGESDGTATRRWRWLPTPTPSSSSKFGTPASRPTRSSSCSRGALAPEPTDDLGEDDESITDVQWTDTVPERLSDDAFVQRTTRLVANRLDTVETR